MWTNVLRIQPSVKAASFVIIRLDRTFVEVNTCCWFLGEGFGLDYDWLKQLICLPYHVWRTIGAKIQLLNFACTFGIRCCSFTICTYICNSTFKFAISLFQLTIWHCLFHNSTSKFTQFNIQVYAIQHSTLKNACFRYPTAIQSMTVSVGSENYQNSPCAGASKGRSRYPRQ